MATQSVCRFYKFGFCKFTEVCRKQHVKELCVALDCDGKKCMQRHPKVCKFLRNYGYCKFGEWCLFSHTVKKDPEVEKLKAENIEIKKKLEELEKILFEKNEQIENILEYMKETRKKENPQTVNLLKCDQCNFETNSKSGLKIHTKKKHTSVNLSYPRKCELCEEELENIEKMKKHIKRHSYKKAEFKCDDCEFVGESEETMEVHIGKTHSDRIECGICEIETESIEQLDTHLFSCEVYQCDECKKKFKTIFDIKKHIQEMKYNNWNSGGYGYIHHLKIDRNNSNEVSDKLYRSDKI